MSIAMPVVEPRPDANPRPGAVAPAGPLREEGLSDTDRNYAIAIHLTPLAGLAFAPLVFMPFVLWLIRKDKSAFVDDHGREVVNLLISMIVFAATVITVITIPFVIAWVIAMAVNLIRGAVAASNGQYFRYPMILRFIS
jgi:uncharacterized Tic20 family protein